MGKPSIGEQATDDPKTGDRLGDAARRAPSRQAKPDDGILVDGQQEIPRVQVQQDPRSSQQLLLRYGGHVIATLSVTGNANVTAIQVRDRTGARNQGEIIDTIDVDVVHPPGVTIVIQPNESALAKTKKQYGISKVTSSAVKALPPYRVDELQVWPPAHELGRIRQRRPLDPRERTELRRVQEQDRATDLKVGEKTREAEKTYRVFKAGLDHSVKQYYEDLQQLGALGNLFLKLPPPTIWNEAESELFQAAKAIHGRSPVQAGYHLKKAEVALNAASAQINASIRKAIEDLNTATVVTQRAGVAADTVGRFASSRLPPPLSHLFSFLYEAAAPPPKNMDEYVDRLGSMHSPRMFGFGGGKRSGGGVPQNNRGWRLPARDTALPIRQYIPGETFRSGYRQRPAWTATEETLRASFGEGWLRQQFRQPQSSGAGALGSTVPDLYHPNYQGRAVAIEAKNIGLDNIFRSETTQRLATQLQQRNWAFAQNVSGPRENWLIVDLRGQQGQNMLELRYRIDESLRAGGRIGNKPGPTYDRVYFILDEHIVLMP